MARTRRKKKRTQKLDASHEVGEKVPRSFVLARGKLSLLLRRLHLDVRKLMMPHTASKLKVMRRNSLKDYVHVAGPLGISHFLIMSTTATAPYLRVARCPHGPTLTFKIHEYSLAADVIRAQTRPREPESMFRNSPLVVMNGFGSTEQHLKLITIMFQNIFPTIDVNTVKLASCQRVLLLNYNKDTKLIDFRHYSISAQPVGASRGIRKLVQRTKIPDLRALDDVSEYITRAGYGSESEAENEASKVNLAQDFGKGNLASHQSAIKLHEVGPRMTLQLVKVEEGLCSGAIMFHEYVKKSAEEIAALKDSIEKREALRKQRRAEQEANVERKKGLRKTKPEHVPNEDDDGTDTEAHINDVEDYDDAEWYRQEVGEEPDEGFLKVPANYRNRKRKTVGKDEKYSKRYKRDSRGDTGSDEKSGRRFKRDSRGDAGDGSKKSFKARNKFKDRSESKR